MNEMRRIEAHFDLAVKNEYFPTIQKCYAYIIGEYEDPLFLDCGFVRTGCEPNFIGRNPADMDSYDSDGGFLDPSDDELEFDPGVHPLVPVPGQEPPMAQPHPSDVD